MRKRLLADAPSSSIVIFDRAGLRVFRGVPEKLGLRGREPHRMPPAPPDFRRRAEHDHGEHAHDEKLLRAREAKHGGQGRAGASPGGASFPAGASFSDLKRCRMFAL